MWEKMFQHTELKQLVKRIYKEHVQINNKNAKNEILKWSKTEAAFHERRL